MCLVENKHRVAVEVRLIERLSQQNTVRHVLDLGFVRCDVLESNRVTDRSAELTSHFFTNTFRDRHGSDTTRLGTSDEAVGAVTVLIQELSELCRLSGTRFTNDDDD